MYQYIIILARPRAVWTCAVIDCRLDRMKVTGFIIIAISLYAEPTQSFTGQMAYDLLLLFAEIAQNFVVISDGEDNKVAQGKFSTKFHDDSPFFKLFISEILTTLTGSWKVNTLMQLGANKILQSGSADPCFLIRNSFEVLVLTVTEEVTKIIEMVRNCRKVTGVPFSLNLYF